MRQGHDRKEGRDGHPARRAASLLALVLASLGLSFVAVEMGYRVLDPFPYFSPAEINHTEHGNLSQYDALLGWKGVPGARELFVTPNARGWLEHNRLGFRDIEPERRSPGKPAIIFLGDSFTWGYEVEFDEMFVTLLRWKLERFEVINLAHRGYGTDQSLLTFRQWREDRRLELVVLMFNETDDADNQSAIRYSKPKPRFEVVQNRLVLTNVPVPRSERWGAVEPAGANGRRRRGIEVVRDALLRSHFLHDVAVRLRSVRKELVVPGSQGGEGTAVTTTAGGAPVTELILRALGDEVLARGGRLLVVAIPSQAQLLNLAGLEPYQRWLEPLCRRLSVEYLDLTPYFERAIFRTRFRLGSHWNRHGHKVAAQAIHEYLTRRGNL